MDHNVSSCWCTVVLRHGFTAGSELFDRSAGVKDVNNVFIEFHKLLALLMCVLT